MNNIVCAPLLLGLITALFTMLTIHHSRYQRLVHYSGLTGYFTVVMWVFFMVYTQGPIMLQTGGYPQGYAITFYMDYLSILMLSVTAYIVLAVAIYSVADHTITRKNYFFPAFWFLISGVTGVFSTRDLFNLYVWFEVTIIASFVLMLLSHEKSIIQGTMIYLALNLLATMLMLTSISFLYGLTGSLDLHVMAANIHQNALYSMTSPYIAILLIALAIKSALFPYYFWLPESYYLTSISAASIFAGILTKVGIYALIRVTSLFILPQSNMMYLILILSCFTMLGGVFGAMTDLNIRRILSFHIVSQVGYMSLSLAIGTTLALTACIFYVIHHILVKTNLFLISGVMSQYNNHVQLPNMGGLFNKKLGLAILFLIPALSLVGIPPFSGFWAKYLVVQSAIQAQAWISATIALVVGFFTLYSMMKIWRFAFWQPPGSKVKCIYRNDWAFLYTPIILLSVITTLIGLFPQVLFTAANEAAQTLESVTQSFLVSMPNTPV